MRLRFGGLIFGRAYFWEGLFLGGLIFGRAYFWEGLLSEFYGITIFYYIKSKVFCFNLVHEGKSLADAISLFKEDIISHAQYFNDSNLKCVIDYTYLTVFQHYKLYQFVLTQDRARHTTKLHSVIEPPTAALPMREGLPKSVWDEQQRLKQIDEMEQKRYEVRIK